MRATDLTAWRALMGGVKGKPISKRHAARLLHIGAMAWNRYEAGTVPVPGAIGLACAALAFGLPSWEAHGSGEQ